MERGGSLNQLRITKFTLTSGHALKRHGVCGPSMPVAENFSSPKQRKTGRRGIAVRLLSSRDGEDLQQEQAEPQEAFLCLRRLRIASPAKPLPSNKMETGSGTAAPGVTLIANVFVTFNWRTSSNTVKVPE